MGSNICETLCVQSSCNLLVQPTSNSSSNKGFGYCRNSRCLGVFGTWRHLRGGILTNKTIPRSPSGSKRVFPSVPGSWHNQLHHPDRPGREHRNMRLFGRQICFSSFLVARMEHPYIWWVDISMVVDVPWWAKFDHQALCQKKVLQYLMLDNVWRSFLIPQTSVNMFFWRIPKFTS